MKGEWVKVGNPARPYCEVATDDAGQVYISVQSGAVRTSDYLSAADAARLARVIQAAAVRAAAIHLDVPPPGCNDPALCGRERRCAAGCDDEEGGVAIIEHDLVLGGSGQHPEWEDRYNAQGAKAARHIQNAREMLENRRHGFALLGATPEGQLILALEEMLGMIFTPEEEASDD